MCTAKIMLAFSEHLSGNLERALVYLSDAEKLSPENADIFSLRGQVY